ncbi:helix-turn-helix transcriptional regulator [Actinosynnema sp. ALI-1.44]|nr:helix-turn-helix transcriptional regulator [Actinosynnema sp. ALI-1.44]
MASRRGNAQSGGMGNLVDQAVRAPDALAMFTEASARLRKLVPFDAAVWRTTDPDTGLMTSPIRTENLDDDGCAVYWDCELFAEDVNLFRDLARSKSPVASLRAATGDLPRRSKLYRDYLRPRGLADELRAVMRVGGRPRGHMSLFRAQGKPAFDQRDSAVVESMLVPLAKRLRSFARPVAVAPGSAGPGLLIFDSANHLVSANDEAVDLLAELPEGPAIRTALGVRVPAWLESTVIQARAIVQEHARGSARIRMRTQAGRWLVCHASCLRAADGLVTSTAVVIEPAQVSEIVPLIIDAYGLSDRELEITQCVSRGLATGEIAERLVLSPHTVRDHIKAIFEKVGVSSRGELVGKLFTEYYEPLATRDIVRT